MTWAIWQQFALGATLVMYIITAIGFYMQRNHGMALAFFCYAISNFGFMWAAKTTAVIG